MKPMTRKSHIYGLAETSVNGAGSEGAVTRGSHVNAQIELVAISAECREAVRSTPPSNKKTVNTTTTTTTTTDLAPK